MRVTIMVQEWEVQHGQEQGTAPGPGPGSSLQGPEAVPLRVWLPEHDPPQLPRPQGERGRGGLAPRVRAAAQQAVEPDSPYIIPSEVCRSLCGPAATPGREFFTMVEVSLLATKKGGGKVTKKSSSKNKVKNTRCESCRDGQMKPAGTMMAGSFKMNKYQCNHCGFTRLINQDFDMV